MKKITILLLFCAVLLSRVHAQGIDFEVNNDLQAALSKAEKTGKLVFVDCYTDWCGPCKYLSTKIFPMREVGDFYNQHFINLSINMEQKPKGVEVAEKYNIKAYPTLLFLNSKGEIVHIGLGAGDEKYIIELGKSSLDSTKNLKSIIEKISKGNRDGEVIMAYLRTGDKKFKEEDLLNDYFSSISDDDKYAQISWQLFSYFVYDFENPQFQFFLKNKKSYEDKIGKEEVDQKYKSSFARYYAKNREKKGKLEMLEDIDADLYEKIKNEIEFNDLYISFTRDNKERNKWNLFIQKARIYLSADNQDANVLNSISWTIYENYKTFNDLEALKNAKEWSKKSLVLNPESSYMNDTYARILFELGEINEAIKYEELAIQKGFEQGDPNIEEYKQVLENFKKSFK